jgi:hypothetical protein
METHGVLRRATPNPNVDSDRRLLMNPGRITQLTDTPTPDANDAQLIAIAAERNALVELVERIYRMCSRGAGEVSTIQKVHSAILDLYADMPSTMVVQANYHNDSN